MPGSRNRPYWWDQDLSAPEEEVWSDEDEGSAPSIAPSDDTPTQFTRDPRPVMQGLCEAYVVLGKICYDVTVLPGDIRNEERTKSVEY